MAKLGLRSTTCRTRLRPVHEWRTLSFPCPFGQRFPKQYSSGAPHNDPAPDGLDPNPEQPDGSRNSSPIAQPTHKNDASDSVSGAVARRLEQATEDALLASPRAARRSIEQGAVSGDVRARLLERIAGANFSWDHGHAISQATLPSAAPAGARADAAVRPWKGTEDTADAVRRMLEDARKPLKPEPRWGGGRRPGGGGGGGGGVADLRPSRASRRSAGERIGDARDGASAYSDLGVAGKGLTDVEREALKREFRERFAPGAWAVPATVSGLAALANERIEDAIARGQFRDIPRGTSVKRDAPADNPFIDTTEYIMNKLIRRQDLTPPWIEKQRELSRAVSVLRLQLRQDWTRHVARVISSRGGSLGDQTRRARGYAQAEAALHGAGPKFETTDSDSRDELPENSVRVVGQERTATSVLAGRREKGTAGGIHAKCEELTPSRPFRDRTWEVGQRGFLALAVNDLNSLARSYNLMAPELAKKPYYSVERELALCYSEAAPLIEGEIRRRAVVGAAEPGSPASPGSGGLFSRLGYGGAGGPTSNTVIGGMVKPVEARERRYGLREFWRDLWKG